MNTKVKFRLNTDAVRKQMKEHSLGYTDIEEMSDGKITTHQLKHFMNKGGMIDEETLHYLAAILHCATNPNILLDPNELLSENIPFEINSLLKTLYSRKQEDILPIYIQELKKFQNNQDFLKMRQEAHRLLSEFSCEDIFTNREIIIKVIKLIKTDFRQDNCIANACLTEITANMSNSLFERIEQTEATYHPHQLFLIFTYAFILFDAVFFAEMSASVAILWPERLNDKVVQYLGLTKRMEIMRDKLIDLVVYKGLQFEGVLNGIPIEDTGLDDIAIKGIILLLATCERCFQHLKGDYTESEYVNRATFSAVLKQLERVFAKLDITLENIDNMLDKASSRFGRNFFAIQGLFKALMPERPRIKTYADGRNDFMTEMTTLWFLNQEKKQSST